MYEEKSEPFFAVLKSLELPSEDERSSKNEKVDFEEWSFEDYKKVGFIKDVIHRGNKHSFA